MATGSIWLVSRIIQSNCLLHSCFPTDNMSQAQLNKYGLPRAHPNMKNPNNPVVFFDISIGGGTAERVIMELYEDVCPRTAQNFLQFCTGEYLKNGIPQGYRNSQFHRVIPSFMVQGGDFLNGDGTGSMCIYEGGVHFDDENFTLQHDAAGLLSMANSGPNTNGCQFFITLAPADFLDGKHTVFGRVLSGMLTIRKIEQVPCSHNNKPKLPVTIVQCGEM